MPVTIYKGKQYGPRDQIDALTKTKGTEESSSEKRSWQNDEGGKSILAIIFSRRSAEVELSKSIEFLGLEYDDLYNFRDRGHYRTYLHLQSIKV